MAGNDSMMVCITPTHVRVEAVMKTVAEVDWLVRALTAVKPLLLPKPTVMTPFNVKPTMAGVSWWRSSVDAGSPKLKLVASQ